MDSIKSGSAKPFDALGSKPPRKAKAAKPKVGRPRLGTEEDRLHALLDHALVIFMREGYAFTSIAKIAAAAGVSTRTIYEHYGNKADLMVAAVGRMVEHDLQARLDLQAMLHKPPEEALFTFGMFLLQQAIRPDVIQFYRMGVAEAYRFPELVAKMESAVPRRIAGVIAEYLKNHVYQQVDKQQGIASAGGTSLDALAKLFIQMVIAEPRHKSLFGQLARQPEWDAASHVKLVVGVFLHGIIPNNVTPNEGMPNDGVRSSETNNNKNGA